MADDQMSSSEMRQRLSWGAGIAIGMGVGVAMGSALDNMGLGLAIGIAAGIVFAIAIGSIGRRRRRGYSVEESAEEENSDLDDEDGPNSAR